MVYEETRKPHKQVCTNLEIYPLSDHEGRPALVDLKGRRQDTSELAGGGHHRGLNEYSDIAGAP